jgi:hypothetical protein
MATTRTYQYIYDAGVRFLVGGVVVLLFLSSSVSAQTAEQTALARTLFQKGVEFMDKSDWEQASDNLRRSLALHPSSVVAYNLALSLEHQQKFIEASELLRNVTRDQKVDDRLRQASKELFDQLISRIGALTVTLTGDTRNVSVTLDKKPLLPEAIGVEAPVDPGPHRVAVLRANKEVASLEKSVKEGESQTVVLDIPVQKEIKQIDVSPKTAATAGNKGRAIKSRDREFLKLQEEESVNSIFTSGWFWLGAGVVAATIVTVVVVANSSK